MARRPAQGSTHTEGGIPRRWESPLEIVIAIALGLAAIVTAGAVYLNEHQEHKATLDFHSATHSLVAAAGSGIRTARGRELEAESAEFNDSAEDHQEKAARYTLAEVILATSLFLFGVAGISSRWRLKIVTLSVATGVFLTAIAVLAIADL